MIPGLKSPLPRTTLHGDVLSRLRQAILSGHFGAGDRLIESRIAVDLGISRAPVREALRQLEQEGLVVYAAHRGYSLRPFDPDDLRELFLLRMALEKLAARLAVAHMTPQEFSALEDIVHKMEALHQSERDLVRATELDTAFHEQICAMARHGRLLKIWSSMADQIRAGILASNSSFPAISGFAGGHREVLEALRARDPARAEAAIERHILTGLESLMSALAKTAISTPEIRRPGN